MTPISTTPPLPDWVLAQVIRESLPEVARRKRKQKTYNNPAYQAFQHRYFTNIAGFITDCFQWVAHDRPSPYQLEILSALPIQKRVSVRGPHGLGKTAMASWAILWFALTRDGLDWKCPTTASVWRQLTYYLWPEIHKWSKRLNWTLIGRPPFDSRNELLSINLNLATGQAFAVASDDPANIEGAHADHILYLFDESKTIPDGTWDAVEGAFSGGGFDTGREALAMSISTPGETSGRFYDIQRRAPGFEDWWVRHVTLTEAIASGRISQEWVLQRRAQWGESSTVYQQRVLGQFATQSASDVTIPLAWVEIAQERWKAWNDSGERIRVTPTSLGVDVGGGEEGGDATVLALAAGYQVIELRRYPVGNTMETTGRVIGLLDKLPALLVFPDIIGVGTGVVHRLNEEACNGQHTWNQTNILPFNAAESTHHRDKTNELGFSNKRSAMWWIAREMLDPASGYNIALPPDDLLTGELTAPRWRVMSGGKIQVEGKDEIRRRIHRSTDTADAVLQALAGPVLVERPRAKVVRLLA